MTRMRPIARGLLALTCAALLAACEDPNNPRLMNVTSTTDTPDEFAVLPVRPLEMPADFATLPPPVRGGANRTDPNPEGQAIAALGGNPAVLNRPSTDGALVTYASRYGVEPGIRTTLARNDLEFRRINNGRILERIFNTNVYFDSYEPLELDQRRELERLRRFGVRTPTVPPS